MIPAAGSVGAGRDARIGRGPAREADLPRPHPRRHACRFGAKEGHAPAMPPLPAFGGVALVAPTMHHLQRLGELGRRPGVRQRASRVAEHHRIRTPERHRDQPEQRHRRHAQRETEASEESTFHGHSPFNTRELRARSDFSHRDLKIIQ